MGTVTKPVQKRAVPRKFDQGHRTNRCTNAIAEPTDINSEQGADHDSDCRFMRHDENVPGHTALIDFVEHQRAAPLDLDAAFTTGRRIPTRVSEPTNVIIMECEIRLLGSKSFPCAVCDLFQPIPKLHWQSDCIAERRSRFDRPSHRTDIDGAPRQRLVRGCEVTCHLATLGSQVWIERATIAAASTGRRLTVPQKVEPQVRRGTLIIGRTHVQAATSASFSISAVYSPRRAAPLQWAR
jgi:hypothetical protein